MLCVIQLAITQQPAFQLKRELFPPPLQTSATSIRPSFSCVHPYAGRGIVPVEIDGASADNKDIRSELWGISGKRAIYPQLFSRTSTPDGKFSYSFIGDWDSIHTLVEMNEINHELDGILAHFK
jgi:hypothetical protein